MEGFIIIWLIVYFLFFVIFLLYQFEILDFSEKAMIHWCRLMCIIETGILILTRFVGFGVGGKFGLGTFYVLNIILLVLQFVFAEFGFGRKLLDLFWIAFYVVLFMVDICDISTMQIINQLKYAEEIRAIDEFLSNSFLGELILAIIVPVCRNLIMEAIYKNE